MPLEAKKERRKRRSHHGRISPIYSINNI